MLTLRCKDTFSGTVSTMFFKIHQAHCFYRWISNFSGVLIGWKDVKIKKDIAFLKGDVSPYIDVPVALKILLFAPKKGELLKGKVISKGYDHIALRVMSLWNSAIAKSRIPDNFDWSVVEDGMMIQFRVSK